MEVTKSFYDLCIPFNNDLQKLRRVIEGCKELGYRTIAIEQKYDHTKRDTTKKVNDIFPEPINLDSLSGFQNEIKILQRLTIYYVDVGITHFMTNSNNLRKYHLIAGVPKTDGALNHCCTTFNGDILSFEPDNRLSLSRKSYQVAVKRGMYFEIKYSSFINCSNHRKDIIKIAHNYHSRGKSKNIIISSGASDPFDLRGPYDIANLALIFGLSEEQGKSSISSTCRKLYIKAESRRLGKTVMYIKQIGPVILSSTDSETESSSGSENESHKGNTDNESNGYERPLKKQKLNCHSWKS